MARRLFATDFLKAKEIITDADLPGDYRNPNIICETCKKNELVFIKSRGDQGRESYYFYNGIELTKQDGLAEFYDSFIDKSKPKRGDIMQLSEEEYRDSTTMIFDGEKFIDLAPEPDDYGTIPEQFELYDEFPYKHFLGLMAHNNYVPFNIQKHLSQIEKNLYYSNDFKNWYKFKPGKKLGTFFLCLQLMEKK